jgi:hypothetical protein
MKGYRMMSFKKFFASAVFTAAAVCGTSLVHADAVTFGTYGTFTPGGGDTATGPDLSSPFVGSTSTLTGSGGLTLTFVGDFFINKTSTPGGTSINLGHFFLSGLGSFSGLDTFTLSLVQTTPSGDGHDTVYTVNGSVSSPPSGSDGSNVVISLGATTFTLAGNETYTVPNIVTVNPNNTIAFQVDVTGQVTNPSAATTTPLPTSAAGGLVLFGLMGLAKIRKGILFA